MRALIDTNHSSPFPTYPTYKDSGLPWLGDIPVHWKLARLRYLAQINPPKNHSKVTKVVKGSVVFLPMENINTDGSIDQSQKRPIEEVIQGFTYFERDDVLVAKITPCFENGKGTWLKNLETAIGFGTTELIVLRAYSQIVPKFLFWVTQTARFRKQGVEAMMGSAGQQRVPASFVQNYIVALPPRSEQDAIVAFLDRKLAEIDRYIANKGRMIALLQEQKTALINRAVTRGLNPHARMKSSGVEWLGEIPEHWEIRRLKFLLGGGLVNGLFKKKESFGSGVRLVNVGDIYVENHIINVNILERVDADASEQRTYKVTSGDIFFVRSSLKLEGVGKSVCVIEVSEPTVFESHVVRGHTNQRLVLPMFLINYLNCPSTRQYYIAAANTVTISTIDQTVIGGVEAVLPPLEEQSAIVEYIEQISAEINAALSRIEREIALMQEYRTALIAEAVTGKIDVREGW